MRTKIIVTTLLAAVAACMAFGFVHAITLGPFIGEWEPKPGLKPVPMPASFSIQAGIPFVEAETSATLVCVSSQDGTTRPPFEVASGGQNSLFSPPGTPTAIHAGLPFVETETNGTLVCVSSRSGTMYPPFEGP